MHLVGAVVVALTSSERAVLEALLVSEIAENCHKMLPYQRLAIENILTLLTETKKAKA